MFWKMSISLSFMWRCLSVCAEQYHFFINIMFNIGCMQNEVVWKVLPIFGDYITELKKANNFAKIIQLLDMLSLSAIFGIPVVSHITWPNIWYTLHVVLECYIAIHNRSGSRSPVAKALRGIYCLAKVLARRKKWTLSVCIPLVLLTSMSSWQEFSQWAVHLYGLERCSSWAPHV